MKVDYGELSPEEEEYEKDPAKYTKEHPEEAKRIHLKRKAERQNALREEYKEKREKILERLSETNRAKNVVVAIMAIIVIVTVLLDFVCGIIVENTSPFAQPVVDCVFKELSVLGCIALLVFMSVKTGFPQQISQQIFGTPSELVEMFDTAHVVIFLVVVLFVAMIAMILSKFAGICAEWEQYEVHCVEAAKSGKSLSEMLAAQVGSPPQPIPDDIRNYMVMRHRFLNPPLKHSLHTLDASFRFSSYLRECTSDKFRELVEVEPETWGVVMVLIILSRLYMMIPLEETKLAIFLVVGLLLLGFVVVTRNKLLDVYMALVHVTPGEESESDVPAYVVKAREAQRQGAPPQGAFYRWCNGGREPNAHERLFWFGAAGPPFLMHLIRTCSFLSSIYFSILVYRFLGDLVASPHETLMVLLSVVSPGIMIYFYLPQVMKLLILTTSIEMMRNKQTVHVVEHETRGTRRFFVARLLHTLKGHARKLLAKQRPDAHTLELHRHSLTETPQLREVKECFDQCCRWEEEEGAGGEERGFFYVPAYAQESQADQRPPGKPLPLVTPEVRSLFSLLGMQLSDDELKDLILDIGDGRKGLRFEATAEFVGGFTAGGLTDQMIDSIFIDIDKYHEQSHSKFDNLITEDEFCAKLVEINPSFFARNAAGAEQLIEWLDWAVVTFKISVASQAEPSPYGTHLTRVFTPQTFRTLLRHGTRIE